MRRVWIGFITLPLLAAAVPQRAAAEGEPETEFRAYWVDAFHNGFKTPAQADQLITDIRKSGANAVIVQVRRRGDAYFNKALEPRTEDPALAPGFDALAYLIEKAHTASLRIEVHAWLATLPIWNSATPPIAKEHVFNRHGPTAQGRDYWLMDRVDGVNRSGADYLLDPGHPDAVDYTVEQYLNVVRRYPVDGIHLDLVRYMGPEWGYNPVSLERFREQTGFSGTPDPQDEIWKEWRRRQVDHLMRKVYLKAIAIRPQVKVSAAVIAWRQGPSFMEEYRRSAPYTEVLQDWNAWLKEGIIDLAIPMNYDREHVPDQKRWYDQWIGWEKDHQYHRQIVAGPGIYLNSIDGSLNQIKRTRAPSTAGNRLAGVGLYSYAVTNKDNESSDLFFRRLRETLFQLPAVVPEMPWKNRPEKGFLRGKVVSIAGNPLDGAEMELRHKGRKVRLTADGSGFFGTAELEPGFYTLRLDKQWGYTPVRPLFIRPGGNTEIKVRVIPIRND
ncbi:family 10 glycosylhydrolase [Salinithrix halophila]|uniref:Family 10 glycosylhydrolase n=1 Tax=Salinithrix halophila TaxID=1485204 RepID=A0ABV8JH02_9BACL